MRPPALNRPPGIAPQNYAEESWRWGDEFACYLVRHDGRYYAWTVRPFDDGDRVFGMPSADDGRAFLRSEYARMLLATSWGECVTSVDVGDEVSGRILYSAGVFEGAEDGIWLAVSEAGEDGDAYQLAGFEDLGDAVEAFAARTAQAADQIERMDMGWPGVAAARLRYLAAFARAGAARAVLGDIIRASRGRIRAERAVSRVASTAGVSREYLYRVLAGDDWTWKGLMPTRKNVLPPRPQAANPFTSSRDAHWAVWVRFAIEAQDESEAQVIADTVLDQVDVIVAGQPAIAPSGPGFWTITADLDLSMLGVIEPDEAQTRLSYVVGRFPEQVTWRSQVSERNGTFEWPPNFWDRRPETGDQLLHPAIRAAIIHVSAPTER